MSRIIKCIEKIMPLCLALFFARTVFIGYKYLFFLSLVPCLVYSVYMLFDQGIVIPKLKTLWMPALVVLLFFVHFMPISNVIKENINIFLILYFIAFSKLYYTNDKCEAFLKWIVRFTMFAGCIAIVRFALFVVVVGISLSLRNVFFEGDRFSLVNDSNFYSLFFIISIILSAKLFANGQIRKTEYQIVNFVSAINIVAGLSRRAYLLYAMVIIAMIVCVGLKKYDFKKILFYNLLAICVIGILGGIMFFMSIDYSVSGKQYDIKRRYYKIYSIIDNNMSYNEFDVKLFRRYYEKYQQQRNDGNLIFNGDLRYGLDGWSTLNAPNDCVNISLIEIKGDNAIRVERGCSSGNWQIFYVGRPILYNKNITYQLSFDYRVVEGEERPFKVGWWLNEGWGYLNNLPQRIESVDNVWNRCTVKYKFKNNQFNPICFLNSLKAGSTIEVKDIRLTCDDTIGLPRYVDQLPDSVIHKYYSQDTINFFTASRTDRWRYALELWQTRYDTKQKILGQGFKYLEWYGEKFYNNPKRYDFPHNPIISSFLYSGIVGGVVYIAFLIMSLWLYWKRRKELGIFFIMYLCCMFFSMFSGSSHFSFPLFAFLSFMPFIEYKKDSESMKIIKNQSNI